MPRAPRDDQPLNDLIRSPSIIVLALTMISSMNLPPNTKPPKCLEEFTFNQDKTLICSKSNWPMFEPLFATIRELVDTDFGDINELRNIVFHFRRGITPKDTDRLRRF